MERRELSKVVKVSDPSMWYGKDTVVVKLFICPEYKGITTIKIFIETIDDFAMEYIQNCYSPSEIDCTYDRMKKWMYDKMPDTISYCWLLEHGYSQF